MKAFVILLPVLFVGACAGEPKIERSPISERPHGLVCDVEMRREYGKIKVIGELLHARADGMLLVVPANYTRNEPDTIVLFPYDTLSRSKFERLGTIKISSQGKEADALAIQRLNLLGRYPQGVSDQLLTDLLKVYHQQHLQIAGVTVFHKQPDN